ncbi:hypothetical protein AB1N83_006829 [Pleurotus pulmonarius]
MSAPNLHMGKAKVWTALASSCYVKHDRHKYEALTTRWIRTKMPSFVANVIVALSICLALNGANAQCSDPARPLARCCMGLAAWSTNSVVWGTICGYTPPDPSEIIGGRCIVNPGTCPSGTHATCCAGSWPGPSGQCALGTNCTP